MSNVFVLKQGDRRPYLRYQLKVGDSPLDVTNATVSFVMRYHDDSAIQRTLVANPIAPTGGVVEPAWTAGSTDTKGWYDCSFVVTFQGGEVMTVPAMGFIYVLIE